MTDEEKEREEAALAEMDQLTAAYREAEAALADAREKLRLGIIRILTERGAAPGKVAEHSPYDRNHVGRLAREGGVPPLRQPVKRSTKAKRK